MEDWFTRQFENSHSGMLVERMRAYFNDSASLTEAFFGLHAQFDMLIEEHDVFLGDGEKQVQDEWTPELVLEEVDEAVTFARAQNSPAWPALASIAMAMRSMIRTVPIMPSTEFKQDEAEGIPPGLFSIMQKEGVRPADLVIAAVADDLSPETLVGAAVAAERARCETSVKDRIKDLLGDRRPDELSPEEGWAYEQFERVRAEIAKESEATAAHVEANDAIGDEDRGDDVDPPSSGVSGIAGA